MDDDAVLPAASPIPLTCNPTIIWLSADKSRATDAKDLRTYRHTAVNASAASHGTRRALREEIRFRHRSWHADRARVRAAMTAASVPISRIKRFVDCGSCSTMQVSVDGTKVKLCGRYCGDRFCVPCTKARARIVRDNLMTWTAGLHPLAIVLTMRDVSGTCRQLLDNVYDSLRRLRDHQLWREAITGGAAFVEITRGKDGSHWHVHLHLICLGSYIAQRDLSRAWETASRGSTVVWISRVQGDGEQVAYAAEYASKGWARACLQQQDWIVELLDALKGRRLMTTFGDWRGRELDTQTPDTIEWRPPIRLVTIIAAARRGEAWACGMMLMVGTKVVGLYDIITVDISAPEAAGP